MTASYFYHILHQQRCRIWNFPMKRGLRSVVLPNAHKTHNYAGTVSTGYSHSQTGPLAPTEQMGLIICLFHFHSSVPGCWHIVLYWINVLGAVLSHMYLRQLGAGCCGQTSVWIKKKKFPGHITFSHLGVQQNNCLFFCFVLFCFVFCMRLFQMNFLFLSSSLIKFHSSTSEQHIQFGKQITTWSDLPLV